MQVLIEKALTDTKEALTEAMTHTDNYLNFLYGKLEALGLERCPCCGDWKEATDFIYNDKCNDCLNEQVFNEMFV